MKVFLAALSLLIFTVSISFAEGDKREDDRRYRYEPDYGIMVDQREGKIYRFMNYRGQFRQVMVDFVKGRAEALKTMDPDERTLITMKEPIR